VIPEAAVPDPVLAYLNANFRPDVAADLLAAAQPLMAIAWDEGMDAMYATTSSEWPPVPEQNPYR
jgi:hypothetical protein